MPYANTNYYLLLLHHQAWVNGHGGPVGYCNGWQEQPQYTLSQGYIRPFSFSVCPYSSHTLSWVWLMGLHSHISTRYSPFPSQTRPCLTTNPASPQITSSGKLIIEFLQCRNHHSWTVFSTFHACQGWALFAPQVKSLQVLSFCLFVWFVLSDSQFL